MPQDCLVEDERPGIVPPELPSRSGRGFPGTPHLSFWVRSELASQAQKKASRLTVGALRSTCLKENMSTAAVPTSRATRDTGSVC